MAGRVPAIYVLAATRKESVDARHKAGRDELPGCMPIENYFPAHFGGRFSENAFGPSM